MALQATHPTSRCCRCLVESAGTQQLCRCPPAHTCTLRVCARIHETDQTIRHTGSTAVRARAPASSTAHQPSDIVSPSESPDPCARKGLAWAGLWQVRHIQIYESCVERASARALRTERSSAKMAMESGRRSRIESRASSCERRGCATHSRALDADGTACFRSVYPAAAVAVRVEHGRNSLRRAIHDWQVVAACTETVILLSARPRAKEHAKRSRVPLHSQFRS